MYQDRQSKISFEELRQQTEVAIRNLAGLPPIMGQGVEDRDIMVASPLMDGATTRTVNKRALSSQQGVTKEQILEKLAYIKQQRALATLNKDLQPPTSAKLAVPGESPYVVDIQPPADGSSPAGTESTPTAPPVTPATPAGIPSIGVLAMGDPVLVKILHDSAEIKGESVIAQLKFANNAVGPHQLLPTAPGTPTPTPTTGAERPAADRSLGLFFWIILGSVVLIVGVWVGFGVVEARSLARRRQEIALDSVKRRTVDQKVLDTYKIRVFKEDDIAYSDDDEDDEDNDQGGVTSSTQQQQEQDLEKGGQGAPGETTVYDDKDLYRSKSASAYMEVVGQPKSQRIYGRADLTALRLVATDRGSYAGSTINSLAMGRRSGSFDETVYGGLDSARLRRGSVPGSIFWERRPSLGASLALSRDERCRSWAESGADMYDYGGESESVYGYDQEMGYKSHAQQGWADLQSETIKSLDAVKEVKTATIVPETMAMAMTTAETGKVATTFPVAGALRKGSIPSLNFTSAATPTRETFMDAAALPTFPAASARRGSAALLAQPTLKHKSRFILPRKIETNMRTPSIVHSGEVTSPTIYGGGGEGSINSAGPSTAGFLPPAGWGGERRRSSLSTVAVPDNGRGVAQPNWIGPRGQRLRRSSAQVERIGTHPLASAEEKEYEEDEDSEVETKGDGSDADDGRGVGNVTLPASQRLRRSSQQVHRIGFENSPPPPPPLMEVVPGSKASGKSRKYEQQQEVNSAMADQKARFSVIGVDYPDIYSPTAGEFSRLSIDAERFMLPVHTTARRSRTARQQLSENEREQQVEQLQDSDSSFSSRQSSRRSSVSSGRYQNRHGKELTTNTMATTLTTSTDGSTSVTSSTGRGGPERRTKTGKQRKRRYDPCAICLEEYEVGDELRELPCKHFFHTHCIDHWFKDFHGSCPVCKRDYSEAGKLSPTTRRQATRTLRVEQPSSVASFLAPLALFATGAAGVHHHYMAEASMYM
ncbi:MAG: hypothetical protein J3R72DRAFT_437840 [Linnemannia gamsii]|nr:MAG: hypothetical protein J3R72DRAFT_437840 [Linnemannia gamsii]